MNETTAEAIYQATRLQTQVEELQARSEAILEPLAKEAMKKDDPNHTRELINAMPRGVTRSELRTHHLERLKDYEYRRRFPGYSKH